MKRRSMSTTRLGSWIGPTQKARAHAFRGSFLCRSRARTTSNVKCGYGRFGIGSDLYFCSSSLCIASSSISLAFFAAKSTPSILARDLLFLTCVFPEKSPALFVHKDCLRDIQVSLIGLDLELEVERHRRELDEVVDEFLVGIQCALVHCGREGFVAEWQ